MSEVLQIKKVDERAIIPKYQHLSDSGADLYAIVSDYLFPGDTLGFHTGLSFSIPEGWEIQIRSRSGLASKGVVVTNSPGTVDAGYRGEVKVLLTNLSGQEIKIEAGDRIAQMVLVKLPPRIPFELVEEFEDTTDRGTNGFGSTGK